MQPNDLILYNDTVCRVLAQLNGRTLLINCLKPSSILCSSEIPTGSCDREGSDDMALEMFAYKRYASVAKYSGNDKFVIIPQQYNGVPVTEIRADAFAHNTAVEGIFWIHYGRYGL